MPELARRAEGLMEDETDTPDDEMAEAADESADPATDPATDQVDAPADGEPDDHSDPTPKLPEANRHEKRLRALAGRTAPYDGPINAITQAWVSRDSRAHAFAARFLDFAVLTDEHLMLCSTGFFSRRPRRRVFLEPFRQLNAVGRGPEPYRTVRVVGDFSSPLLIELRSDDHSLAFARALLERTHVGHAASRSTPSLPADEPTEPV